jgi:gamma-glutamyltranspeptidase/glutathione hydrolase
MFRRDAHRGEAGFWTATSPHGVVCSAHYLASQAGASVLARGGNAVDAAAATSFALAVCEPAGSGLGGMAIMVLHWAESQETFTIEGSCRAPQAATPEAVAASHRYRGYPAIAVPTFVAAWDDVLAAYGSLGVDELLAPAIRLAEEGFPVTALQHALARQYQKPLRGLSGGPIFLVDGRPPPAGHRLRQPALARTLRRLSKAGLSDFYHGQIARRIAEDIQGGGGFVSLQDLECVAPPRRRKPLCGSLLGRQVCTVGPPAGGLTVVQMAEMFTALEEPWMTPDTPRGAVQLAAIIRRARQDRRACRLKTEAEGVGKAGALLGPDHNVHVVRELRRVWEGLGETSHVCAADGRGNVVSLTQSIERCYGSAAATPELGFLYNGYLRAFKVQNKRHPHFLRPGAPARSNASPTIVLEEGRPWAAVGSTGSERMASAIFTTLVRLLTQSPFDAVGGPRLHATPEGLVLLEAERFPPPVLRALESRGFLVEALDGYSFKMGGLQLLARQAQGWTAVADPRRDGAAIAPVTGP